MSNLKALIADDLNQFSDLETATVTHRPRRNGVDGTDKTLENVRRLMLRRSEQVFASISITDQAIRFIVKENELTDSEIVKAGDFILIGTVATPSEVWKVARSSLETFDTLWVCDCSRVDNKQ